MNATFRSLGCCYCFYFSGTVELRRGTRSVWRRPAASDAALLPVRDDGQRGHALHPLHFRLYWKAKGKLATLPLHAASRVAQIKNNVGVV